MRVKTQTPSEPLIEKISGLDKTLRRHNMFHCAVKLSFGADLDEEERALVETILRRDHYLDIRGHDLDALAATEKSAEAEFFETITDLAKVIGPDSVSGMTAEGALNLAAKLARSAFRRIAREQGAAALLDDDLQEKPL